MFPALMIALQSLRAFLLSRWRLLGSTTPQPKVVRLNRDELPDHLRRDLGIFDGDRSDREPSVEWSPRALPMHDAGGRTIHFDVVRWIKRGAWS